MARIVYGVSGERAGHSSRSRVMLTHLQRLGHTVKVVSYDRGYTNLKDDFDVFETEGLHIASNENRVKKVKTFTDNLKRLSKGQQKLNELRHAIFKAFKPHAVITDFEPMTAYLAHHYELPLISIDNQHRLRYMRYDCPVELKQDQHKPYLALPMIGQFEQEINAHFLAQLGYGVNMRSNRSEAIGDFLYRLPELAERLTAYPPGGNDAICNRLTALTADNCIQAQAFRRQRKEV